MLLFLGVGTLGGVIRTGDTAALADAVVLLLPSPIHTDIVLPATPEVRRAFAFLADAGQPIGDPATAWIVVGWGAHDFYMQTQTASDLRLRPALKAIMGDTAVMRIETGGSGWDTSALSRVTLNASQFSRLVAGIRGSIADTIPLPGPGFNPWDAFYPAKGRFTLWRTCNVWVGDMLRQAGARVGIWTPFTWTLP
ncbi:TIGR02117 family protein [Loktanella sp. M215]|uniref:TIGR02117 family protein n=1 Tax=Loktanella sp. M215 TaxID=2675431 RepID=UPI001F24ACA6